MAFEKKKSPSVMCHIFEPLPGIKTIRKSENEYFSKPSEPPISGTKKYFCLIFSQMF